MKGMINHHISNFICVQNNAIKYKKQVFTVPKTKDIIRIIEILKKEGYIESYKQKGQKLEIIRKETDIEVKGRVKSKPGRRIYIKNNELGNLTEGLNLIRTSKGGILTEEEAYKNKVGGEWILNIK